MTLEAFMALMAEAFKTAQADPSGNLMRELINCTGYIDAVKTTVAATVGRTLMAAVSGVASTDAEGDLPSDPAALRAAILAMVQGEIQKAMMVKRPGESEGSEIEVSLGDAYGALMTDMAAMKTDMAAFTSKMDALPALENKVATAATDAKRALDASTGANTLAKLAKDAADAVTEADRKRIEKDAADGAATRLAAARNLATEFGMTKDAAAGSELSDLVKHLRLKRVGGCTENDSDDAVIASARTALSMRGKSLPMATDAASTIKATIDPTAYFG